MEQNKFSPKIKTSSYLVSNGEFLIKQQNMSTSMRFASAEHKVRGQTSPRFLSINYILKKKSDSEKQTEIVVSS